MNNFWEKLNKPFFVLAPMADVTDPAFRRIIAKYGKPDVTWTEFVSADGLAHPVAREKLIRDLAYTETERPIVAQLFSSHPEQMRTAARIVAELGYDGIDINMGCPDRSIEKQGAGAAMMKTPDIAGVIIQAAKDGIRDAGKDIPLSVKTRVGYNQVQIDEWIPFLLSQDIATLTVHARTRKELSSVPANWSYVKKVVEIRNKMGVKTRIIGNGDVHNVAHGRQLALETGCDGIMIGRAIFGNPWMFANTVDDTSKKNVSEKSLAQRDWREQSKFLAKNYVCFLRKYFLGESKKDKDRYWLENKIDIPVSERLRVLVEHTKLYEELLGDIKSFSIMKKHYKAYCNGFTGAKELRMQLMDSNSAEEVENIIDTFLKTL
ncbi:MAG: tRNA-dihydrouridine synthase family protein [Candidatus Nomurabacteria bacterium]|nr:tRNA-dihydrouridine synthase family protein [Candidatus Nomurabacteria bacterium]